MVYINIVISAYTDQLTLVAKIKSKREDGMRPKHIQNCKSGLTDGKKKSFYNFVTHLAVVKPRLGAPQKIAPRTSVQAEPRRWGRWGWPAAALPPHFSSDALHTRHRKSLPKNTNQNIHRSLVSF